MTNDQRDRILTCVIKKANKLKREGSGRKTYPVETFYNQLRELCQNDGISAGADRGGSSKDEAEQAVTLACSNGLLVEDSQTWEEFLSSSIDDTCARGTEHLVNFDEGSSDVIKITIPPGFGLTPQVKTHEVPNLRNPDKPTLRHAIEFERATPLEYLQRWICSNEVFDDNVRLASVVRWEDGEVSFVIRQPVYGGKPAPQPVIDEHFRESGWEHLSREKNHTVFFNYAYGVIAIDALPRNCYATYEGLNPFDVILCKPDEALESYLGIYSD